MVHPVDLDLSWTWIYYKGSGGAEVAEAEVSVLKFRETNDIGELVICRTLQYISGLVCLHLHR